ncbi:hypothetical protein [endosymbiont GvMRE of Glomus versiforme]|uniref:hypothetical protein n=1 Tax=endosymbiont GvMRE of Glomus versiforme TaxID=2039283 RepID=UPI000ECC3C03|nr:hypothetical protein [endosymbiont GvMRE of Glomus versiforme]RHZ37231.1 CopG family DNA-binding protein, antitoxin [endosymbiont GvMRE of Glomus versiforme]
MNNKNITQKEHNSRRELKKEISLTVKLPKEWVEHLFFLEETTKKTKDYYVREALYRYLEDLEDLEIGLERLKSKSRTYTSEEADKRLKELRTMKGITKSTFKNV